MVNEALPQNYILHLNLYFFKCYINKQVCQLPVSPQCNSTTSTLPGSNCCSEGDSVCNPLIKNAELYIRIQTCLF